MKLLPKFIFVLAVSFFNFVTFAADTIDPFTKEFLSSHFRLKAKDVKEIKIFGFEYKVVFQDGKRDSAQDFFNTLEKASIPARFCDGTDFLRIISVDITEFQKDKLIKASKLTPRRIVAGIVPSELVKIVINAAKTKRIEELLAINKDNETFLGTAREVKSLDLSGEKGVSISDVLLMLERLFSNANELNLSRVGLCNESLGMLLEGLPLTAVNSLTINNNDYDKHGEAMIEEYATTHQNIKIVYDGFVKRTVKKFEYTPDCFEYYYDENFRDRGQYEYHNECYNRVEQTLNAIKQARANCERQAYKIGTVYDRVTKKWLPRAADQTLAQEEPRVVDPWVKLLSSPEMIKWVLEKHKVITTPRFNQRSETKPTYMPSHAERDEAQRLRFRFELMEKPEQCYEIAVQLLASDSSMSLDFGFVMDLLRDAASKGHAGAKAKLEALQMD